MLLGRSPLSGEVGVHMTTCRCQPSGYCQPQGHGCPAPLSSTQVQVGDCGGTGSGTPQDHSPGWHAPGHTSPTTTSTVSPTVIPIKPTDGKAVSPHFSSACPWSLVRLKSPFCHSCYQINFCLFISNHLYSHLSHISGPSLWSLSALKWNLNLVYFNIINCQSFQKLKFINLLTFVSCG